ncbi:hypothetical protein OIU85_019261 [Salix viminalis]|uniref:Uncharacterized protein n=1 Tax=Salix viminalis TaxID=40686 RepID=A0A9Q0UVG8_SALVM|nr:hypothetical protein OIU85_019261 [Salix viminalis]
METTPVAPACHAHAEGGVRVISARRPVGFVEIRLVFRSQPWVFASFVPFVFLGVGGASGGGDQLVKAEMKGVARLLSCYTGKAGRVYRWRDVMGGSVAVNIDAPFSVEVVQVDMFR